MEYQSLDDLDAAELVEPMEEPEEPTLPFVMLFAAIIKDTLDLFLSLTGVGLVLILPLSILMSVFITIWAWQRGSASPASWRKRARRKMWIRWLFETFGELLPTEFLPWTTWFVYSTYRNEMKEYRKAYALYEAAGGFA